MAYKARANKIMDTSFNALQASGQLAVNSVWAVL